jgi:hypothetical protein
MHLLPSCGQRDSRDRSQPALARRDYRTKLGEKMPRQIDLHRSTSEPIMRVVALEEHFLVPALILDMLPVSFDDRSKIAHGNADRLLKLRTVS